LSEKVAIYTRVSSEDQAERQTVEAQLHACRQYAEQRGWQVVVEFRDEGVSGSVPFEERPEGRRLLEVVGDGLFSRVLVLCVDRLSRDVVDAAVVRRELDRRRTPLEFVHQSFDGTPGGELQYNIFAAFAQYERRVIGQRTHDGRRRQVRDNGKYMASITPYGYRRQDGSLVENPEQAEVVRKIFRWALEGDGLVVIAGRLNQERIPPPNNAKHPVHRSNWGWHATTVYKLLIAPRYIGKATYDGEPMVCPPLVDEATFDAVRERLKERRRNSPRNTKRFYLLQHLVYCRCCGGRYMATVSRHGAVTYVCRQRAKYGERAGHENIKWRWRAEELEEPVKRHVWELLTNPQHALAEAQLYKEEAGRAFDEQARKADLLLRRIDELEQEEQRVLELARQGVYRDTAQLIKELESVRAERQKRKAELEGLNPYPERDILREADDYLYWLADLGECGSLNLDDEGLRDTIRRVVRRVWVEDDGRLTIEGVLSGKADTVYPRS
jgi:site-specific DNA recombinase